MSYYLAIDIGASGGRHILGRMQNGKLILREIYRFDNQMCSDGSGSLVWDIERLFSEITAGMRRCTDEGIIPTSVAIDTWGVDYVLLDRDGAPVLPVYAYRDGRTDAAAEAAERIFSHAACYERTGIQRQNFNTIYQLYDDRRKGRLAEAKRLLMLPEYFAYRLCGKMRNEYTNATTTGLLNARERNWDSVLLSAFDIPASLFEHPCEPPVLLGSLTEQAKAAVGYDTRVVLCPTHDTACAVVAGAYGDGCMYLSSGTWSLAGIESPVPITDKRALHANFTNEGGTDGKYRFLKNIMGMWLLQNIRGETGKRCSYDEMMRMAESSGYTRTVDVNHPAFVRPDSMIGAIRAMLGENALPLPDLLACVYRSLAECYRDTADEIEQITGRKIHTIRIFGGGSADRYLNRLCAQISGRTVIAGLKEATAVGNLLSQIKCEKPELSWGQLRKTVQNSFDFEEIKP